MPCMSCSWKVDQGTTLIPCPRAGDSARGSLSIVSGWSTTARKTQTINPTATTKSNTFTSSFCYFRSVVYFDTTPWCICASRKNFSFDLPPNINSSADIPSGWMIRPATSIICVNRLSKPSREITRDAPDGSYFFNRFACAFRYSFEARLERQLHNKKHLEKLYIYIYGSPAPPTPTQ